MITIKAKIQNRWNNAYLIFIVFLIIFPMFMACISTATFFEAVLFSIFQIFMIFLPGIAFAILLRIKLRTKLELVALGYALGYALNIVCYYLTVPFGLKAYLRYLLIAEAGVAIVFIVRRGMELVGDYEEDYRGNLICTIFILFMVFAKVILYYGVNKIPATLGTENFIAADILYYIGNMIELAKEYPPVDFRWNTQLYKYHYWGSLQLSVIKLFMNSSASVVELCFGFMQGPMLLVFAAYTLFHKIANRMILQVWGICSIVVTAGIETLTFATYTAHLYVIPFGFDIGLAFVLYTLYFMVRQIKYEKIQWNTLLCTAIMLAVAVGSKAPIAVILMIALGILCAYELFVKHRKNGIIYGIVLLATFITIYFGVVSNGFSTINSARGLNFAWIQSIKDSQFWTLYTEIFAGNILKFIGLPLILILYILLCNPNIFITFIISIGYCIRHKSKVDIIAIASFLTAIGAVLFTFVTVQEGKSQMYFMMAAYSFGTIFSVIIFDHANILNKRILIFIGGLTMIGILLMPLQHAGYIKKGLSELSQTTEKMYDIEQCNLLTYSEYEAYNWVRVHTPEDAMLASNVMLQENQGRSYITGVFTERHVWLEGWDYIYEKDMMQTIENKKAIIKGAMEGKAEALDVLKNEGVSYLVQIKRVSPKYITEKLSDAQVFENEEVIIYQIK